VRASRLIVIVARYIRDMATTLSSVSISLEGARRVMDAALAKATEMGIDACISVCDPGGHAVITVRMDGAPLLSVGIASNKAYTVIAFKGMPTHLWWGALKDDPSLVHGIIKTDRFILASPADRPNKTKQSPKPRQPRSNASPKSALRHHHRQRSTVGCRLR
jgi:glc operon protein GlcG